ncbi:hypothetical protein CDD82_2201 [Ophiocordyceps australis]|uniref:Zn(2)-C6 fungal-type domain-containing protein n=1 Tax=Ophiocordyceps australis TaxID=1399860 RepID=A0A2C5ZK25_9HYPO|nr:hypothetical protein CDD82_2201 [Ophiocordyceps australis]
MTPSPSDMTPMARTVETQASDISRDSGYSRQACTECQRRKQKCNREWPCNHCQKRKVADKCRFGHSQPSPDKPSSHDGSASATLRKRRLSVHDAADLADVNPWDNGDSGFEALGYTASHLFSCLNPTEKQRRAKMTTAKHQRQFYMSTGSCSQLERALNILPPRPYTDSLVQNFLNNVNFHYYMIYPPSFLDDYRDWWASRSENKPLGLPWTCLLLMVCACSAQYTDIELQQKLETDLGQTTQQLTESYHNAARELHSVIPVGNNHLLNVQTLLHSCYWYKSEARFVECWHVLSAAIREAQGLDINQESIAGPMTEFEREMRRRIWCVLDTWDWQISALLSRPMIIDRTDCNVGLPSLKLEGYTPSPLLHMKLQSELITQLAGRFGLPKHVKDTQEVKEYQKMVESWMAKFPKTYAFENFDDTSDMQRPWIVLHRHYLWTMSYSMLLDPIRAYLAKPMTRGSPTEELEIRSDGIGYSLKLMSALYGFFNHVYPRDAKFHFVLFCIFDTAAVLCSALIHDQDGTIPRRHDILHAIEEAVAMLKRLKFATKTAKTSYEILLRVSQRVIMAGPSVTTMTTPQSVVQASPMMRKRARVGDLALTPPNFNSAPSALAADNATPQVMSSSTMPSSHDSPTNLCNTTPGFTAINTYTSYPPVSSGSLSMDDSIMVSAADAPSVGLNSYEAAQGYDMTPPTDDFFSVDFGDITHQDLGDLASLWDYGSLNFDFINPPT